MYFKWGQAIELLNKPKDAQKKFKKAKDLGYSPEKE